MKTPELSLLVKLASIAAHAAEFLSADRHDFDKLALQQLLKDKEVTKWLKEMGPFVPLKRK